MGKLDQLPNELWEVWFLPYMPLTAEELYYRMYGFNFAPEWRPKINEQRPRRVHREVVAADGNVYTAHSSTYVRDLWYIDLSLDRTEFRGKHKPTVPSTRMWGRIEEGLAGQACFVTNMDNDKEAWPHDRDLVTVDAGKRRGKRRG